MNKRKWTDKQRKIQACNLRRRKIWEASTGPRTVEGKAASARNAKKHGYYSADMCEIRRILRLQREYVKALERGCKTP